MKTYTSDTLAAAIIAAMTIVYVLAVFGCQIASSLEHREAPTYEQTMAALAAWEEAHPDEDLD